ncbi:MAG: hypothetical protein H6656_18350 [Ardenticatenaceae bacterium]|nr:hypothetical protein [Ardenticatenaceae bacterium]
MPASVGCANQFFGVGAISFGKQEAWVKALVTAFPNNVPFSFLQISFQLVAFSLSTKSHWFQWFWVDYTSEKVLLRKELCVFRVFLLPQSPGVHTS